MSWFDLRVAARVSVIVLLGAMAAGCFQPMYAERTLDGKPGLRAKLAEIEFPAYTAPNGSREARLGVAIRNAMMFNAYGSATGAPARYALTFRLSTSRQAVIVDSTTARPDVENYGIDATYELREIVSQKVILRGSTLARVSFDDPGQEQRFAVQRGLRDAEDRAAQEIADNISTRLASFLYSNI